MLKWPTADTRRPIVLKRPLRARACGYGARLGEVDCNDLKLR